MTVEKNESIGQRNPKKSVKKSGYLYVMLIFCIYPLVILNIFKSPNCEIIENTKPAFKVLGFFDGECEMRPKPSDNHHYWKQGKDEQ
jgi:hypothetical protein